LATGYGTLYGDMAGGLSVIGDLYKTEWKSYEDYLTVNSTIPFFLPPSDDIKSYTKGIAMKYGWMWISPLQSRHGSGYIFDDRYIDEIEAKKEVEEYFGHEVKVIKKIKFKAGSYKKVWVNNCIAVGVSTGFTEPLEATSIWISLTQLDDLTKWDLLNPNSKTIDLYNKKFCDLNDDILDFIQFHYFTKRKDTPFWRYYNENVPMQYSLKGMVDVWKTRCPITEDFSNPNFFRTNFFSWHTYMYIGVGLNYFDNNLFVNAYEKFDRKNKLKLHHTENIKNVNYIINNSLTVADAIKIKL
jgi:tryptophan halogenase